MKKRERKTNDKKAKRKKMKDKRKSKKVIGIAFATIMMATIMMMIAIAVSEMAEGVVANASCNDTYWDSQMSIPSTATEFNVTGELPAMAKGDVWVSSADEIMIWPSEAPGPTCWACYGKPHPSTGPNSATWFHYRGGGCGEWKVFSVSPGIPIRYRMAWG